MSGKLEPHAYVPSWMHMGDCAVCGHLQESAIHKEGTVTPPLRQSLLNEQISIEARRIAHRATATCRSDTSPNVNDFHSKNCNKLKEQIEALCLQIKCAALQPKRSTDKQPDYPPDFPAPGDLGSVPL